MKRELLAPLRFKADHPDFELDGQHTEASPSLCAHRRADAGGLHQVHLGHLRSPSRHSHCRETEICDVAHYTRDEHGAGQLCCRQLQRRFAAAAGSFGRRNPLTSAASAP